MFGDLFLSVVCAASPPDVSSSSSSWPVMRCCNRA
jgi:hypothetical protein